MKTWYRQPSSAAGRPVRGGADLQGHPDQAVALRRRRLRDPMVALDHSLEQPGQRLRADGRMRRRRSRSAPTSISRSRPMTSATPSSTSRAPIRKHRRRRRPASSGWSACSRISFRARSISRREFRAAGITVVIGGFHVSGCISMLPELPPDLQSGARSRASSLFAGEAEGRMADAAARHRRRHRPSRSITT